MIEADKKKMLQALLNNKVGFSSVAGTTQFYTRHVLVCTGRDRWKGKIEEEAENHNDIRTAHQIVKSFNNNQQQQQQQQQRVLLTLCDLPPISSLSVIVFPERIRLSVDSLKSYLESPPLPAQTKKIKSSILVCTHSERDCRCGERGTRFHQSLVKNKLDSVEIIKTSHIGGHKHAPNVIVYPSGDWFGLNGAEELERRFDELLQAGSKSDYWRGRIGLTKEQQVATYLLSQRRSQMSK